VSLLTKMQGQLVHDAEIEEAAFKQYSQYCSDATHSKGTEIDAAKSDKDMLQATISKASSDMVTSSGKIEDSTNAIAENDSKLKTATQIRAKDAATFKASEQELMQSIDMLGRAIDILDKEMAKSGASSLLQNSDTMAQLGSVVMGLSEVVEGAGLGASEDLQKLTALLQDAQQAEDGEDSEGLSGQQQPAYEKKSGSILEVLDDLRDKAETQLRDVRNAEVKAINDFELVKQALETEIAQYTKELDEEKVSKEESTKSKATAEGNLEIVSKALADTEEDLSTVQKDCMQKSADHEATKAGRDEELKVLAQAKKIIQGQMGGGAAALQTGSSAISFTQTSMSTKPDRVQGVGKHVVTLVQRLANQQKSSSLSQLASRISAVLRYGLGGDAKDPFAKVKSLLSDMIKKLQKEQAGAASEKEYCDREMKKTSAKKEELEDDAEGLKSKIDQAVAASAKLKADVKDLQFELATLLKLGQDMKLARSESKKVFLKDQGEMQTGLNAVRAAIHVLKDYYAADKDEDESLVQVGDSESDEADMKATMEQPEPPEKFEKSTGAGQGIIGMLEVVESDLAKDLALLQTEEDDAETAYEKEIQEMKVTKAAKDQDVVYSTKEYKSLDKSVSELGADFSTASEELAAVNEYFAKVKDRCVAKPESYADRRRSVSKRLRAWRTLSPSWRAKAARSCSVIVDSK